MKIALMINPYSGGKKGIKLLPVIEEKISDAGIEYDSYISLYHGHMARIISGLIIDEYDAIISVGGDGTNFQILNALLSCFKPEQIPPIGIIPIGSGNSFARDLNIFSPSDGLRSIIQNRFKWVDLCSFSQGDNTYFFINLLGLGFVTDVAKTAQKFKWIGDFSYLIGIFHRTLSLQFHDIELEYDGQFLKGKNCFVEFCNSRFTGGNLLIAPDAEIDDGKMDIIVAEEISKFNLLKTLPKIYNGKHLENPLVHHIKAKTAKIRTSPDLILLPDGEIFGSTPTTVNVHHKMVRYLS